MPGDELTDRMKQIASIRGLPVVIAILAWFAVYLSIGGGLTILFGLEGTMENPTPGSMVAVMIAFLSAFAAAPSVYWWIHGRPIRKNLKREIASGVVHGAVAVGFSIGVIILLAIAGVFVRALC